jgi:hypothetical protein
MREARVLRGKGPLIYPENLIPRHVRARRWNVWLAGDVRAMGWTCLFEPDYAISEKHRKL